jgi:serine O-acetyltransferase
MFKRIKEDIQSVFNNDPAAKNIWEVILCYPGLHALWFHRIAHCFYKRKWYTIARLIAHISRSITGIEIHPGAQIGRRMFIDHGMGIVIGETAEIGEDCLIYKGVVLGGTTLKKRKRHPTLGSRVEVGSNACILGAITIGDGARIGSGSVVIKSVPEGATVVGVPGRILRAKGERKPTFDLEHGNLPDPLAEVTRSLLKTQERLEERLKKLESIQGIKSPELMASYNDKEDLIGDLKRERISNAGSGTVLLNEESKKS